MANYHTQFCVELTTNSQQQEWLKAYFADEEENEDGMTMSHGMELQSGDTSYVMDSDGCGELERLAGLLRAYLKNFDPSGHMTVRWAETCDRHRADAFGGGAVLVTANKEIWCRPDDIVNAVFENKDAADSVNEVDYDDNLDKMGKSVAASGS